MGAHGYRWPRPDHPLVGVPLVVTGATASGKSSLALEVARQVRGAEIVSVDSMAVYRGMDIGTATPDADQRGGVAHHLLSFVDPGVEFTLAEFQAHARAVLDDMAGRGAPAVLAGGTVLYLRAVTDDLNIPGRFPQVRAELEAEPDTAKLHGRLASLDSRAAGRMEPSNRRRVIRALEVTIGAGRPFSSFGPGLDSYPDVPFAMIGLWRDYHDLDTRIEARFAAQMDAGFLDEVRALSQRPLSRTAAQALGYRDLLAHLRGEVTLDEACEQAVTRIRRFARRQMRWLRRDPRITWIEHPWDVPEVLDVWERTAASQPRVP